VLRAAVTAAIVATAAVPAAAHASRIVYGCGSDLCAVAPDGGARKRLTRDGEKPPSRPYREPSLSRDGRRIAFARGLGWVADSVWVADGRLRHRRRVSPRGSLAVVGAPRMRPDGKAVLWLSGFTGASLSPCWTPLRRTLSLRCNGYATYGAAWGPRSRFLVMEPSWFGLLRRLDYDMHGPGIALSGRPPGVETEADFVLSPDARRLAVSEVYDKDATRRIVVYDVRSWRRLRVLTAGHRDLYPSWSPDGRWIAFWRDPSKPGKPLSYFGMTASIERVPARGGPVRTVVSRRRDVGPATWGGRG
jgi:dipeptidyl aminopeptidase/acylaminoacyl peptidase